MSPDLSVVIPSHRRSDLLLSCLESVQKYAPCRTEVIVMDDGSPQGQATRVAERFPGVSVLRASRPRGFCAAVNAGIRAARAPIVELLNDDAEVCAGWAQAALTHFRQAKVVAVAPLVLCWPGQGPIPQVDSAGDRYALSGIAGKRGHRRPLSDTYLHAQPVFGASGSSAFYRREAILRAGAFPESFGAYFEDVDLAFRLQRAGGTVIFEPNARVLHRVSGSYGIRRWGLLARQSRNEELVYWRNLPARVIRRSLPLHLMVLAGKALKRLAEGTLMPFALGRLLALLEAPRILRHRRSLSDLGPDAEPAQWCIEESLRFSSPEEGPPGAGIRLTKRRLRGQPRSPVS